MSAKTAAEIQMEELKRMKAHSTRPKTQPRSGQALLQPEKKAASSMGGFELVESKAKALRAEPSLPLSRENYKKILMKQKASRDFKGKREMGEWAAELILGLPGGLHRLSPEAKAELFQKISEWAAARGLK